MSAMFTNILSFLCGIITGIGLICSALWYVLSFFFYDRDTKSKKGKLSEPSTSATFQLPPALLAKISDESFKSKESCWALNFVLYFLFRELKNSDGIRRWILRKLSLEFDELLASSVLGKFFSTITIQNVDIGENFPVLNWLRTSRVELHSVFKSISALEILVDLTYAGGFQFSIQADTHLRHSATLSVQVNAVKGVALLKFSAEPYAHWSFSFAENPDIDISVVSQLYGKSFSQVTSIIAAQLKRSVRKKHTIPMYKIRYKPFFNRVQHFAASLDTNLASRVDTNGTLTVTIVECRSLMQSLIHGSIYANVGVGDFDWVAAYCGPYRNIYVIRDIICIKTAKRESNLDFTLTQRGEVPVVEAVNPTISSVTQVILSTIQPETAFSHSELQLEPGDEVIAVDGKRVTTVKQCIKNFRTSLSMKVVWRIRRSFSMKFQTEFSQQPTNLNSKKDETPTLKEDFINQSSFSDKLRMPRRESGPPASPSSSRKNSLYLSTPDCATELLETNLGNLEKYGGFKFRLSSVDNRFHHILRSKEIPSCKDPIFLEPFSLAVEEPHRFLNLTLWSTNQSSVESSASSSASNTPIKRSKGSVAGIENLRAFGRDSVLGHLSIPLTDIIADCLTTGLGYFTRDFYLCSPDGNATEAKEHALKSHSGFEPDMCYGVITLSFLFKTAADSLLQRRESTESGVFGLLPVTADNTGAEPSTEHSNNSPGEDLHPHQFYRTHFRNAAICDYCNKKIWLKDAYTCRACGMKCHKKCNERCMVNSVCRGEMYCHQQSKAAVHAQQQSGAPEIITTESEPVLDRNADDSASDKLLEPNSSGAMNVRRKTLGGLIVSAVQNRSSHLKRTGSATTLSPALSPTNLSTRSLPPSPQASPTMNRKAAVMTGSGSENNVLAFGNPFQILEGGELGSAEETMQLNTAVDLLIKHSHDDLVQLAKETGKDVFPGMSLTERKLKCEQKIHRLQSEIDAVTMERNTYEKESTSSGRIAHSDGISNCEEKIQALALLMLYFCAGLQHVQELHDQDGKFDEDCNLVQFYDEDISQEDKVSDTCSQDSSAE